MPNDTLNGIVLRATDYRESDRILNILTMERGLVAAIARGCRKQNNKNAAFASQFCYGEVEVYERAGKLSLSTSTALQSFYPIRESYEQLVSATRVVMATERVATKDIANNELFFLCYHALSFISYGDCVPADIELCFLVKLLKLSGYAPVLTSCVKCGRDLRNSKLLRFSCALGGAVCENCGSAFCQVSALSLEAIRRMMLLDSADMGRVKLPDSIRQEIETLIYNYAEFAFDSPLRM